LLLPGHLPPHGASALPACLAVLLIHAVALLNSHVDRLDVHLVEGVVTTENSDKLSEDASEGQNKGSIEASSQDEAPLDVMMMTASVMATTASLVVTLSALSSTIPVLSLDAMTTLTLVAALLSFALLMSFFTISPQVATSLALVSLKNLREAHGLLLLA